ncbi:MAG: hypothetical protein LBE59_03950 [Nevskiaceae bacterium]|jgi:hypothetical protein|nr:hypothetical protein [Nevskiaceae bacterium]
MRYLRKIPKGRGLHEPLLHGDHPKPVTRRQLLSAGLMTGAATVVAPSLLSALMSRAAWADVRADLADLGIDNCGLNGGAGKVPFICFDLAGGANIAGSNVIAGGAGGQMDFLSAAAYSRLGLPGNMTPNLPGFVDTSFGLAFHSDSAFLRGMQMRAQPGTAAGTNGTLIAARSENDTGNNPHNPMYGIARTGASGELLTLIGSQNSESGGNSMAPASMIDPQLRPTKVDRASDVTGLVDTGELRTLFADPADAVSVMESMARLTNAKHARVNTLVADDARIKEFNKCGYVKSAYLAERFSDPASLDPARDTQVVGESGIFTQAEYDGSAEFRKTAAVMKMVIDGNAGAGTIQMGGFDYHTGERATGETRDLLAGQCMGACLEYAARVGRPLMIYVFSDGSLSSGGAIDNSQGGRGKGVWTSDNQATAASFFLVYRPGGAPLLRAPSMNQIGWFGGDGSVITNSSPAANAVNQLVETVILNYMALNGEEGRFATPGMFPNHSLGGNVDRLIAFDRIL